MRNIKPLNTNVENIIASWAIEGQYVDATQIERLNNLESNKNNKKVQLDLLNIYIEEIITK